MNHQVSPKRHHGGLEENFEKAADTHMVEIGTSSIMEVAEEVVRPDEGVGYAEESFIAASANQHEETMFDDDITSALLNGINSNAA